MSVVVPGARPNAFDIQKAIILSSTFRAWISTNVQVTRVFHPCWQSTGREAHPYTDQALRLEAAKGRCVMGPAGDDPLFSRTYRREGQRLEA